MGTDTIILFYGASRAHARQIIRDVETRTFAFSEKTIDQIDRTRDSSTHQPDDKNLIVTRSKRMVPTKCVYIYVEAFRFVNQKSSLVTVHVGTRFQSYKRWGWPRYIGAYAKSMDLQRSFEFTHEYHDLTAAAKENHEREKKLMGLVKEVLLVWMLPELFELVFDSLW